MKWMLCLFVIMLLATMPAAAAEISGATASQILAELQKMNGELAALKADMAEVKADVAILKADVAELKVDVAILKADVAVLKTDVAVLKAEVQGLREYVDVKISATTSEIRSVNRRVAVTEYLLIALVTALVTVLLWMLKNQWDKRRADSGKMDAQEKEIATQQAEIIALRAENERMKNASGLVSSTGGRLESE